MASVRVSLPSGPTPSVHQPPRLGTLKGNSLFATLLLCTLQRLPSAFGTNPECLCDLVLSHSSSFIFLLLFLTPATVRILQLLHWVLLPRAYVHNAPFLLGRFIPSLKCMCTHTRSSLLICQVTSAESSPLADTASGGGVPPRGLSSPTPWPLLPILAALRYSPPPHRMQTRGGQGPCPSCLPLCRQPQAQCLYVTNLSGESFHGIAPRRLQTACFVIFSTTCLKGQFTSTYCLSQPQGAG